RPELRVANSLEHGVVPPHHDVCVPGQSARLRDRSRPRNARHEQPETARACGPEKSAPRHRLLEHRRHSTATIEARARTAAGPPSALTLSERDPATHELFRSHRSDLDNCQLERLVCDVHLHLYVYVHL